MKFVALLAVSAASLLAVPAIAQDEGGGRDKSQDFNGPYVSVGGGGTLQGSDRGETLVFDTDRDGVYGDPVNTVGGTDAFSPGFCNGAASGTTSNFKLPNTPCTGAPMRRRRWASASVCAHTAVSAA